MKWKLSRNGLLVKVLIALVLLGGSVYGGYLLVESFFYESTDNAYITGTIVPVSAEVRGRVVRVSVADNQFVKQGEPLVEIFRTDYVHEVMKRKESLLRLSAEELELKAALEERSKGLLQEQANLAAAASEEDLARREFQRYERLIKEEAISQSQYDRLESLWKVALSKKESAFAAVAEASASLEAVKAKVATHAFKIKEGQVSKSQAELDLTRTLLKAPIAGRIAMKNVDPGKYVQPGQTLLSIVQDDTWVTANFKEIQIKKMTVGQPVRIKVDAYPGKIFKGHVDSLQPGTGAVFSLLPPENATGNFVKVVQRVPVKIILDSGFDPEYPLWPGLSVIPSVDVTRPTGRKLK